jgi:hypothetical protein
MPRIAGSRRPAEYQNPLISPALMAALHWLQPSPEPRLIVRLIRRGRVSDAAEIITQLIAAADRP